MNPRSPTPRQLEQLFQNLEDGSLSAEDHDWLMNLLRHRPEIRREYREHMVLATGLHDLAEAWGSEHEEPTPEPAEIRQRRTLRHSFLAAAAVVTLLAAIGSLIAIRGDDRPPATAVAGSSTSWRFEDGGIDERGDFLPATRVTVDWGTLELTTRTRTRILLEGPASYEIHDRLRGSLASGKGWFDVTPADKGFTVLTEHLRVIDLGTRFGVATSPSTDRVQVDAGQVRLESRFPGITSMDLRAGEAAVANLVGRSQPAEYDPALFLHVLPRVPVSIHWSFDHETDGALPATASGFTPLPIRVSSFGEDPAATTLIDGRFGSALDLRSDGLFAESDFAGVSGSGPRTVALWIKSAPIPRRSKAGGTDYTPSILTWGDPWQDGAYWSIRAHTLSGLIGTQWDDTAWVIAEKYRTPGILDGEWHHIASVFTGGMDKGGNLDIRHYIDGKRVTARWRILGPGIDTRSGGDASSNLRLAYDVSSPGGPSNVPVAIDELHIVRGVLDDDQIDTLFRENRLSPAR